MALYPGAEFKQISGHSDGPFQHPILGVILHVNAGSPSDADTNIDLYNYVTTHPGTACPHFQVGKAGKVWQYVDTGLTAWCQSDGNAQYLSIETQGLGDEPATDAQVTAIAGILAWLREAHGIPLVLAESPGHPGFGWHGMGGNAWGGHPSCPGVRKDQRQQMLTLASETLAGGGTQEDDMFEDADRDLLTRLFNSVVNGGQFAAGSYYDGLAQSVAAIPAGVKAILPTAPTVDINALATAIVAKLPASGLTANQVAKEFARLLGAS